MTYLLDTHIILWTLFDPSKLPTAITEILINETDKKIVTSINLWEISLKYSLGKLNFENANPEQITAKIIESGFEVEDMPSTIFSSYYKLPKKDDHKDPFDRLLIWYAIQNGYSLISRDSKIFQYIQDGLDLTQGW